MARQIDISEYAHEKRCGGLDCEGMVNCNSVHAITAQTESGDSLIYKGLQILDDHSTVYRVPRTVA